MIGIGCQHDIVLVRDGESFSRMHASEILVSPQERMECSLDVGFLTAIVSEAIPDISCKNRLIRQSSNQGVAPSTMCNQNYY